MGKQLLITQDYIDAQRRHHKQALLDLDAMERVLQASQGGAVPAPTGSIMEPTSARKRIPTKRRIILTIVSEYPLGVATRDIIAAATRKGYEGYQTGNVSPKLSFYKEKGWLTLDGGLWKITSKGKGEIA